MIRKKVLVLGPGSRCYREYLLRQLADEYDVYLFSERHNDWADEYSTVQREVNLFDPVAIAEAVGLLGISPDGILSWDERFVIAAADLAEKLGLLGPTGVGIRGCRDKQLNRQRLASAGLIQPRVKFCVDESQAVGAAEELGYPVVVKPRGMGGSIGVRLARARDELALAFHDADKLSLDGAMPFRHGALVESYLDGEEISIDGVSAKGAYIPVFIARKVVGLVPYFEELGHSVAASDPLLNYDVLIEALRVAHAAIGFQDGITHTEVKLTSEGPAIVEINGRLGGDLIPYLAQLATGIKPGLIAGQIAVGDPVDLWAPVASNAAIAFLYPAEPLVFAGLKNQPEPRDTASGYLTSVVQLAAAGQRLAPPPDEFMSRIAYAITVGADPETALRISNQILKQLDIASSPQNA